MNHFATLTPSEYKQMLGFKPNPASYLKNQNPQKIFTKKRKQSDSLDWWDKGVVNPIKNQYACGSC